MNISNSTSWSDPRGVLRPHLGSTLAQGKPGASPGEGDAGPRSLAGVDSESDILAGAMSPSEAAELTQSVAQAISGNWGVALSAGAGPSLRANPGLLEAS